MAGGLLGAVDEMSRVTMSASTASTSEEVSARMCSGAASRRSSGPQAPSTLAVRSSARSIRTRFAPVGKAQGHEDAAGVEHDPAKFPVAQRDVATAPGP